MSEEPGAAPLPPTVAVVAVKVAEQLMSDMYRRVSELEARLEQATRDADEAERAVAVLDPAFADAARELLARAETLRAKVRPLVASGGEPQGARLLAPRREDPSQDTVG